jgi:hypothetical protein
MAPLAEASHVKRIVWPYGVDERHVPVVAGFKVVPDPLPCDSGFGGGDTLYEASFEVGMPFAKGPALTFDDETYNFWGVTSIPGRGTDTGHDGPGKLYFGNPSTGMYKQGGKRVAGAALMPALTIPAEGLWFLSFHTKWHTEWFEGYDHMWVEAVPADGNTYILCTLNPEGRADSSSDDVETAASCSPYKAGPCISDLRRLARGYLQPLAAVDPDAPHWESRYVMVPPIWAGQAVTFRFAFDSADGVANTFMGWMLDDVQLTSQVTPGLDLPPIGG